MDILGIIIVVAIVLFSAIVHEVCHGLMAEKLGDDTAREMGRITLNPIPHIDPFGSIILPLLLLAVGSPIIFGAARPVPVNFANLRPRRLGMACVALAGPASNFALAIAFGLIIKTGLDNRIAQPILIEAILINLILGTFNLIPIPPLDGSKILVSLAPEQWAYKILGFERYGFILVVIFLLMGWLQVILLPALNLFGRIFGIDFGM